jgi:hypothetical protein
MLNIDPFILTHFHLNSSLKTSDTLSAVETSQMNTFLSSFLGSILKRELILSRKRSLTNLCSCRPSMYRSYRVNSLLKDDHLEASSKGAGTLVSVGCVLARLLSLYFLFTF